MNKVEVEILGLSTSPASNGAYALILQEKHGSRRLPIIIGANEATAIALEIEGIKPPRPLTHDLIKTVIDSLGANLLEVIINDLHDGTFYAQLVLDGSGIDIDSRPSDAIALATRFNSPIFVFDEVMNEAAIAGDGEESDEETEELIDEALSTSTTSQEKHTETATLSPLEILEQELVKAIEKEDYETAALLRDEINKHNDKS